MKIIENTCGKVCPVVKNLKDQIAVLEAKLERAEKMNVRQFDQINRLTEGKEEGDRRIAKARQALFGILDQPKIVGGP